MEWEQIAETESVYPGFTAPFRIEKWNVSGTGLGARVVGVSLRRRVQEPEPPRSPRQTSACELSPGTTDRSFVSPGRGEDDHRVSLRTLLWGPRGTRQGSPPLNSAWVRPPVP